MFQKFFDNWFEAWFVLTMKRSILENNSFALRFFKVNVLLLGGRIYSQICTEVVRAEVVNGDGSLRFTFTF